MIGSFGGPNAAPGYDFEATKWVPLFEGEWAVAREIIAKLEELNIPHDLTFPQGTPEPSIVIVKVMKKFLARARREISGAGAAG